MLALGTVGGVFLWEVVLKPAREKHRARLEAAYPVTYAVHRVAGGWSVLVTGGNGWSIDSETFTSGSKEAAMRDAKKWVEKKREIKYVERGKF